MSAFGTKKPNGDMGLQLTFPAVYSELYAKSGEPLSYYPEAHYEAAPLLRSDDLQGDYHAIKMEDARRKCMNGVRDTTASQYRADHSHAGYVNMPRAVLSQRVYANPSNGNQSDIYSNRPTGLQGGVLYTAEAQTYGRKLLKDRAAQLDAINVAKEAFRENQPVMNEGEQEITEGIDTKGKIELVSTLRAIFSYIAEGNITAFTFNEVVKFLKLLFRWAVGATQDELEEVLDYVDEIETYLLGSPPQSNNSGSNSNKDNQYAEQILDTMRKVREYLRRMVSVNNRPFNEKKLASANFIKALGFTNLTKGTAETAQQALIDDARSDMKLRAKQAGLQQDAYFYGDDSYFPNISPMSRIVRTPRVKLNKNVRDKMGEQNGAWYGQDIERDEMTGITVPRNPFRSQSSAEMKEAPQLSDKSLKEILNQDELTIHMPREKKKPKSAPPPKPPSRAPSRSSSAASSSASSSASESSASESSASSSESPRQEQKYEIQKRPAPLFPTPQHPTDPTAKALRNGNFRPQWLTSASLNGTRDDLAELANRLTRERYGSYTPRRDTGRTAIRSRIKDLWNL